MSIASVTIEHYRSIKHCVLNFHDINLLIGENGTGKSNILDAIRRFYDCMLREEDDPSCYNFQNRFSNEFSISLTFDFRHLKQISKKNLQRGEESDYDGYYSWISRRKSFETLTMRQVKGKAVRWNQDRRYRQNILNLFPLYVVDARKVDLTDWSQLWEIIGDLMKVHRTRAEEISKGVSAIKDKEEYKLKERFQKLSEAFRNAGIQVKAYTPKQYASTISTLFFQGNEFSFKDNRLDYMSNGTNAFNYTILLIETLKLIFEYKVKEPAVILDEPEISLHHKLIDRMTARILSCSSAIRFFVATHSPRMLKDILKLEQANCKVIHVSAIDGYTHATEVRLFSHDTDERLRVFMNDQHANAYFSRYILSVEGASETEVFSNPFLQELFPFLRDVDVMEGMSDDVVQKIISPVRRNFQTRFLLLADMDKVMSRSADNRCFELRSKYFPERGFPQEKYYYSPLRTEQCLRLKRIRALAKQGRFRYWLPFFSCKDPNFYTLTELIFEYFRVRNLYIASTTIEGMLITFDNLPIFWEFCRHSDFFHSPFSELQNAFDNMPYNDRLNFVRLLFSGKSDFILNFDEICKLNPRMDPDLKRLIETNRQKKTGGWISDWLKYYLCSAASWGGVSCESFSQFSKAAADPQHSFAIRRHFYHDFRELFCLLEIVRSQMKGR